MGNQKLAMGNQTCNGKPNLQWETKLAMGNQTCNGKPNLQWETKLAMGNQTCNGKPNLQWETKLAMGNRIMRITISINKRLYANRLSLYKSQSGLEVIFFHAQLN